MFEGIPESRFLNLTAKEERLLDNAKKAIYESDQAMLSGHPADRCLEEIFKAIDTVKTLRRSMRGEDTAPVENKKRFIEFLGLEIPAAQPDVPGIRLWDADKGKFDELTLGQVAYLARCKIHENENLNAAENPEYHILVDWDMRDDRLLGTTSNGTIRLHAHFSGLAFGKS